MRLNIMIIEDGLTPDMESIVHADISLILHASAEKLQFLAIDLARHAALQSIQPASAEKKEVSPK